ncbi:hypothetical protein SEPCBS57363_004154 [Sporothrix epigloea]|uniref:Uncharacterized protein n=1 Tax=Sporothrix epigloea TaxID=1892477 RepID=A0ABP0DRQ5_9PEZI
MLGNSAESSPEELLDVFKAAALSVTKLYKTSAAVQSKARIEGYQDCLEDLLTVLEKGETDVRTIRRWVVERLDGREPILPTIESEDEVEKTDSNSTPEPQQTAAAATSAGTSTVNKASTTSNRTTSSNNDTSMQTEIEAETEMETEADVTLSPTKGSRIATASAVPTPATTKKTKSKPRGTSTTTTVASTTPASTDHAPDHIEVVSVPPPTFDHFSFRSSVPYPTESFLELANLDLSDRRSASGSVKDASETPSTTNGTSTYVFNAPPSQSQSTAGVENTSSSPSHTSGSRQYRIRHPTGRPVVRNALTARMNRSTTGQKRKLNFDEIFDLASLGYGKDVFGRGGGKRSRQA